MESTIDPKLLSELLKLTGYLVWATAGSVLAFVGLALRLTWVVSGAFHELKEMRKDLNGYGKRTQSVQESNAAIKEKIVRIETTLEHLN